ncbi:MAG TPA: hypothetical protein VLA49_06855 [Anaerolineales bacterium]|nr:hypothetical protein [Anaerolineales bacterium]
MKYKQKQLDPQMLIPFGGSKMECVLCGATEKSPRDPDIICDWRAVQLASDVFYACPDEFPPDGADDQSLEAAYRRFIEAALTQRMDLVEKRRAAIIRSFRGENGKLRRKKVKQ